MRGISKKRLREWKRIAVQKNLDARGLLDELLNECAELNAWLPIDENTPKDRELLLYDNGYYIGHFDDFDGIVKGCWVTREGRKLEPARYQELPADPKE